MTIAMPAVNPVVTGYGMNWIRRPRRARPIAVSSTPAISVASIRPPGPKRSTTGSRITTNAAVGPDTCTREPPSAPITAPATIAV